MTIIENIVERTGVDDIIALLLVAVACYLWMTGQDIPDNLSILTVTVVGFFFGKKYTEKTQAATIEALNPKPPAPLIGGQ